MEKSGRPSFCTTARYRELHKGRDWRGRRAARILSGYEKETLSKIIFPFAKEIDVHSTRAVIVDKLYAYRGDEQAVAHGATKALKATPAEPSWCFMFLPH